MRVLWFTNTPSLSAHYLNNKTVGGAWIESLEAELIKNTSVHLGICFNVNNKNIKPFVKNKTIYYPINNIKARSKVHKLTSNWLKSFKNENNIQPYLDVIEDFKPDIINIFGTEGPFGLIIQKINIPCIIHLQGNLNIYTKKWFSGITAVDVLKHSQKLRLLKGNGLLHDYLLSKKMALREQEIFHDCKYFMGRTDWDKRFSSVLSPNSIYFHCDEIMRPGFYSVKWEQQNNNNNYTIITTIRNNIYKGLETILECKTILNDIDLDRKIIWKIAGLSKSDEIVYLLEKKYRTTFKDNDIELLGPLEENPLIDEMVKADLFIHPSHIDNSPNSLCEAMLIGMPVIATFAGGIPSLVENNKEGLLIQDGDPYALAGSIIELIKNSDYAIELGANARTTSIKRHNPEKIVNKLLRIYSSLIK